MTRTIFSRRAIIDALLILAALAGANWLIARADPGWIKLSPSPYLLLPILIGGRYGFLPGILSGFAAMMSVLLFRGHLDPTVWRETLEQERFLLCSFPVLGAICGEVSHYFLKANQRLSILNEGMNERLRKTDADNCRLRQAKDDLDRGVAARDGEISTLDTELRRLYSVTLDDLPRSVLLCIHRQTRILDAAIYLLDQNSGILKRAASLGDTSHLPEDLHLPEVEIARLAWERKTLVALPELLIGEEPEQSVHLLAVPFLDSKERAFGLLLVSGMAFVALNRRNIESLDLLTQWTAEILDLQLSAGGKYRVVPDCESQRIFTAEFFERIVHLAYRSYRDHNMQSSLLLIEGDCESMDQPGFESLIMPLLRTGDYAAVLHLPHPHLAILLPLIGERGASICQNRILQHWRATAPELSLPQVARYPLTTTGDLKEILAGAKPPILQV